MRKTLEALVNVGGVSYKKDLALYISSRYERKSDVAVKNASAILKRLEDNGYARITDKSTSNTPHDVVRITEEGERYLARRNGTTLLAQRQARPKLTFNYTSDAIKKKLRDVRAMLFMQASGAQAFTINKPSLEELYSILSGTGALEQPDTLHKTGLSKDEFVNMLSAGLFYTDKEIRHFLVQIPHDGTEACLNFNFSGLYINQDKILMVFVQDPGETKSIVLVREYIDGTIARLKPLSLICKAYRNLRNFGPKSVVRDIYIPSSQTLVSAPHALIISNGPEMIYSSVANKKYGKSKLGSQIDAYEKKVDKRNSANLSVVTKGNKYAKTCLRAELDEGKQMFRRLFTIPFSYDGLSMNQYLLHTSIEDWYAQSKQIMNVYPFLVNPEDNKTSNQLMPGQDKSFQAASTVFLPVPESNLLRTISDSRFTVSIITVPELVEPLNRAVRSDKVRFYTYTDGQITQADTMSYARSGYGKAQEALLLYLKKDNLYYTDSALRNLPTIFNMERNEFWSRVSSRQISYDEIISAKSPLPIPAKKRKKNRKTISIEISEETDNKINYISSIYGKTKSYIIKSLIYSSLDDMYRQAKEKESNILNREEA